MISTEDIQTKNLPAQPQQYPPSRKVFRHGMWPRQGRPFSHHTSWSNVLDPNEARCPRPSRLWASFGREHESVEKGWWYDWRRLADQKTKKRKRKITEIIFIVFSSFTTLRGISFILLNVLERFLYLYRTSSIKLQSSFL